MYLASDPHPPHKHTIPTPFMASLNPYEPLTNDNNENNYSIVDSEASDNYLAPTANVKSKTSLHHPIQVILPDKSCGLQSSHACQLTYPYHNPHNKVTSSRA
eukprot:CCRYP_008185-RA/>CCRYP_008185-RA protein AED:0.92 eAED:1.00 QI:0/-1/0/1/-1/1/1/0/101